jgi:hypothetical protein
MKKPKTQKPQQNKKHSGIGNNGNGQGKSGEVPANGGNGSKREELARVFDAEATQRVTNGVGRGLQALLEVAQRGESVNTAEIEPGKRYDEKRKQILGMARQYARSAPLHARAGRWRKPFLYYLKSSANITFAAAAAGITTPVVYRWKAKHPEFASEMESAISEAVDFVELCAWERATLGTVRPVFMKGSDGEPKRVDKGEMREYSDKLTELLLCAHRPAKYRKQTQMDITSAGHQITPGANIGTVQIVLPSNGRENLPPLQNPIDIESENQVAGPQKQIDKEGSKGQDDPQGSPS